jgi:hypothetical protein
MYCICIVKRRLLVVCVSKRNELLEISAV